MQKKNFRKHMMTASYLCGVCCLFGTIGVQFWRVAPSLFCCFAAVLTLGSIAFVWGFLYPCTAFGAKLRPLGFAWLGIFTYGVPVLGLIFLHTWATKTEPKETSFWYAGGTVLVLVLLLYARLQAHRMKVKTYRVESTRTQQSMRVVFLSDLHFEAATAYPRLARAIARIHALSPNVVVICGDIFYDHVLTGAAAKALTETLATLSAPLGVYACLGNHDNDSPHDNAYTAVSALLAEAGIVLLADEAVRIGEWTLVGRKDRYLARQSAAELLAETDGFTVVLDHQPNDIPALAEAGADLILCGHTHRGQLIPVPVFHTSNLFYGRRVFGRATALVTCGFGWYGPPLRLGSTGEIGVVEVVPAAKK